MYYFILFFVFIHVLFLNCTAAYSHVLYALRSTLFLSLLDQLPWNFNFDLKSS